MNKNAAWQREYLRLILQPSERSREYQAVVVTLKLRTVVMPLGMTVLLSQPSIRYQLLPIHHKPVIMRRKFTKKQADYQTNSLLFGKPTQICMG